MNSIPGCEVQKKRYACDEIWFVGELYHYIQQKIRGLLQSVQELVGNMQIGLNSDSVEEFLAKI